MLWFQFAVSPLVVNKKLQRHALRALALVCSAKDPANHVLNWGGLTLLLALHNIAGNDIVDKQISRTVANLTSHSFQDSRMSLLHDKEWTSVFQKWTRSYNMKIKYNALRSLANIQRLRCGTYGDGLFLLYPKICDGEMAAEEIGGANIDIIFVHGLNGSAVSTK